MTNYQELKHTTMKRIPYGISNYEKIKTENYYFVDKTQYIAKIEEMGAPYLFFLRPRRFGKSLFLSILERYYDILAKDKFDALFSDTYIGQNPTPLKTSYAVLKFNFSMVSTYGTLEEIRQSFNLNVWGVVDNFIKKYTELYHFDPSLLQKIQNPMEAGNIMLLLQNELKSKNILLYLIIDEYDNFANNILIEHQSQTYKEVTHGGGFLRNFFTIIKGLTDNREIDRLFITGVSPLVMADVTSGFNIGDNISLDPELASMVGLTTEEATQMIDYYTAEKIISESKETILNDFNVWYNGYSFSEDLHKIYNTVSVLYYINQYIKNTNRPSELIDENMRTDYGKLSFLFVESNKLNGNFNILKQIAETGEVESGIVRSFSHQELHNEQNFISLLYYLGFTSIKAVSPFSEYTFCIPNKLIRILLWNYIQNAYNDVYELKINNHFLGRAFNSMATKGEYKPVFQYIIDKFYEAVSLRDFTFHEEGVKTCLLAWLNLTHIYDTVSEAELNKGYADIVMQPTRRYAEYVKYDYIIELKYVKATDCETAENEQKAVEKALSEAKTQLAQYAENRQTKTIKIVVVVSAKKLLWIE